MVKCKKCQDGRDYEWDKVYGESTGKWRLWDFLRPEWIVWYPGGLWASQFPLKHL